MIIMSKPSVVLRMEDELSQLQSRLGRANAFINTSTYDTLPDLEQTLFSDQVDAMRRYEHALNTRLGLIKKRHGIN